MQELFSQLSDNMWKIPQKVAEKQSLIREAELDRQLDKLSSGSKSDNFYSLLFNDWSLVSVFR